MDNGSPWGNFNRLPSALALWLVGLGITPLYGRPAHSSDNGVVERDHGVLAQWVELDACSDFDACQQRLAWAVWTQRERYRSPHDYTRAQAFPTLYTNPRSYQPQQDQPQWNCQRVADYLSGFSFQRKVEINGRVTLFANAYSLGTHYARQQVQITFDPTTLEWIFADDNLHLLRRHAAKELSYERISQLQLAKRRRP